LFRAELTCHMSTQAHNVLLVCTGKQGVWGEGQEGAE